MINIPNKNIIETLKEEIDEYSLGDFFTAFNVANYYREHDDDYVAKHQEEESKVLEKFVYEILDTIGRRKDARD